MSLQVTIVGPTKGGKTVYVACLMRAAFAPHLTSRPIKVRPAPGNEAARRLEGAAVDLVKGLAPFATASVVRIELVADLPGSILGGIGKESLHLTLIDTPGGDCMPPPGRPVPDQVSDAVRNAPGLLLALPADPRLRPADLADRLRHLASVTRGAGRYPFLRIAVVVTMAELLAGTRNGSALGELERMNARSVVETECGTDLCEAVRSLTPAGGDGYFLVSAYGFDPESGRAQAERFGNGWRLGRHGMPLEDGWWPYRVFEPLEFLARGVCWREAL